MNKLKFKDEKKTKIFGNERFTFVKCCNGNHDLKITEQRLRNDGYIVRTEFINGKHNVYQKEKSFHGNYWGTTPQFWNRNPLLPKQEKTLRVLTFDSDKDGKRDWEDCRPLNPKKQDVEGEFKTPQGKIPFRTRHSYPKEQSFAFKDETGRTLYRTYTSDKVQPVSDIVEKENEERISPSVPESSGTPYYCENCHKEFVSNDTKYNRAEYDLLKNVICPYCSSHRTIKMYNRS